MQQVIMHRDHEFQGGVPVFVRTRVPHMILFESLKAGHGLDQFLENYPSVSREPVLAALELAGEAASERALGAWIQ